MAFQPEAATYDTGVLQLETTTPVQGGVGGASNTPLLNLANRTTYLKQHVDAIEAASASMAPLASPAFTGSPTVPNVALGDRSTKAANTQFVQDTINSVATVSVAGGVNVNLTTVQAGAGVLVLTGVITANIAVIVPAAAKQWVVVNSTTGAFTVTVKTAAGTGIVVAQSKSTHLVCDATNVFDPKTDFPSPFLSGIPTAPTPSRFDNTQQLATTAFMRALGANFAGVTQYNATQVLTAADVNKALVIGSGGGTITLPDTSTCPLGSIVAFTVQGGTAVIQRAGTDTISVGPTNLLTSITLKGSDFAILFNFGGAWMVMVGTPLLGIGATGAFGNSSSTNGYQIMPGGTIFQWGVATCSASADVSVSFPLSFPGSVFGITMGVQALGTGGYASFNSQTLSGFNFSTWSTASVRSTATPNSWWAFGK